MVKVDIESSEPEEVKREFKTFAKAYFATFNKTPFGMQRVVGHYDHTDNSRTNGIKQSIQWFSDWLRLSIRLLDLLHVAHVASGPSRCRPRVPQRCGYPRRNEVALVPTPEG